MTKRDTRPAVRPTVNTDLDLELDSYKDEAEVVQAVIQKEDILPTFSLAANGRIIIVYNYTGAVTTDTIVQFRNLYSKSEVGKYDHNGATVLVE